MITQALSCTCLGFGVFPFPNCIIRIMVPLMKKKKNVFAMMNSSSLNIFSTRHVISISEKVCLEKTTQL